MNQSSPELIAANKIKEYKPNFTPKYAIILGSGLGSFTAQLEDATIVPYEDIPGFPSCGVKGHAGNLHLGTLHGTPIACLEGRPHLYEGKRDTFKIFVRSLKLIGCDALIATNAVGSLKPDVGPGNLVLIQDHINFQGTNILMGPNDDHFGDRFIPMGEAYDKNIRLKFLDTANKFDIPLTEGVYKGVAGPCFETPAEIRAFKLLGADVVGMSLIPEVVVARHCGLKVAAVSVVTNLAEGMSDVQLSHEQTLEGAKLGTEKLTKLLSHFVASN